MNNLPLSVSGLLPRVEVGCKSRPLGHAAVFHRTDQAACASYFGDTGQRYAQRASFYAISRHSALSAQTKLSGWRKPYHKWAPNLEELKRGCVVEFLSLQGAWLVPATRGVR